MVCATSGLLLLLIIEAIKASGMFAVGVGNYLEGADYKVEATSLLDWGGIKEQFSARL
jgi:beta-phosphoglucomutase